MPIPDSFIKNIAFEIDDKYQFDNTPNTVSANPSVYNEEKNRHCRFVGREKQQKKFLEFLASHKKKGVFLVTGFRGMGKTSFVNKVLSEYKYEKSGIHESQVIPVHLTLTQNCPKEIDILRLITVSVYESYQRYLKRVLQMSRDSSCFKFKKATIIRRNKIGEDGISETELNQRGREAELIKKFKESEFYKRENSGLWKRRSRMVVIFCSAILVITGLFIVNTSSFQEFITLWHSNKFFSDISAGKAIDYFKVAMAIFLFTSLGLFFFFLFRNLFLINRLRRKAIFPDAYTRIQELKQRCYASVHDEEAGDQDVDIKGFSLNAFLGLGQRKRTKQFAAASDKEIEYELHQFLEQVKEEHRIEFIFVFDELDKVEAVVGNDYMNADMEAFEKIQQHSSFQLDLRNRKQAIMNIISGLKNFFTTASARFVFIAGHEMFDASLADISDRQSSISSIFTYTFNIDSILKDEGEDSGISKSSLSNGIEHILKSVMLGEKCSSGISLHGCINNCYNYPHTTTSEEAKQQRAKIYFIIQNFLTFLTYRSNGSPKKLLKAIQEFIVVDVLPAHDDKLLVLTFKNDNTQGANQESNGKNSRTSPGKYLYFNYYNQYRIGFINYLYRPFLIQNGRSFKLQRDSIILSTPYLFDHLIKFHPFAFSITNLELIPEVLSSSKTPTLKEHIRDVIYYLGSNHIRETDIGLFDFKFYSRSANEIVFLTKIFEEESAAFNFTLDESYLVKLHINNKIKELRSIFSKFLSDSQSKTDQLFSITHLNGTLGDLHFFDQEFDDAIVAYSDAIRPINERQITDLNMRDFITLVRNKLKLGLCFEKINSFEEALSFYIDTCQDAKRYMYHQLRHTKDFKLDEPIEKEEDKSKMDDVFFKSSSLNDILQIIIQGFLAKIIIQEKMGVEGISTRKLSLALGGFFDIADHICGVDVYRNNLIVANAFMLTGKLLFYKNSPSTTVISKEATIGFSDRIGGKILAFQARYNYILNPPLNGGADGEMVHEKRKPVLALYYYLLGLDEVANSRNMIPGFFDKICKNDNVAYEVINQFKKYRISGDESFSGFHYRYMASFLSSIGDCLLAMINLPFDAADSKPLYNQQTIDMIFDVEKIKEVDINCKGKRELADYLKNSDSNKLQISDILYLYWLSGYYFNLNGRTVSCSFQYRKILHVLRVVMSEKKFEQDFIHKFLHVLEYSLVNPVLAISNENNLNTDRHTFSKIPEFFNQGSGFGTSDHLSLLLSRSSNHPELREVMVWYTYINIKLGVSVSPEFMRSFINPYNSFATQFGRLIELDLFAKYSFKLYNSGGADKQKDAINYFFSMVSILRILKIYGSDYLMGASFLAYTYFRLGDFIEGYSKIPEAFKGFRKEYSEMFGSDNYTIFDPVYHYRMARDYYAKAIQLHTAGKEYRKQLNSMVYLEDDFNDNAYHFGAALDRYLMVNKVFSEFHEIAIIRLVALGDIEVEKIKSTS